MTEGPNTQTNEPGIDLRRRGVLAAVATAPLVMLLAFGGGAQAAAVGCVDMDALPPSQKSLRRTLGFQVQSSDPNKRCGLCTFFTASPGAAGCGQCALLSGGAVNATSVCKSWTAKA